MLTTVALCGLSVVKDECDCFKWTRSSVNSKTVLHIAFLWVYRCEGQPDRERDLCFWQPPFDGGNHPADGLLPSVAELRDEGGCNHQQRLTRSLWFRRSPGFQHFNQICQVCFTISLLKTKQKLLYSSSTASFMTGKEAFIALPLLCLPLFLFWQVSIIDR